MDPYQQRIAYSLINFLSVEPHLCNLTHKKDEELDNWYSNQFVLIRRAREDKEQIDQLRILVAVVAEIAARETGITVQRLNVPEDDDSSEQETNILSNDNEVDPSRIKENFIKGLSAIKKDKLYKNCGCTSWKSYVSDELGLSLRSIDRMIKDFDNG